MNSTTETREEIPSTPPKQPAQTESPAASLNRTLQGILDELAQMFAGLKVPTIAPDKRIAEGETIVGIIEDPKVRAIYHTCERIRGAVKEYVAEHNLANPLKMLTDPDAFVTLGAPLPVARSLSDGLARTLWSTIALSFPEAGDRIGLRDGWQLVQRAPEQDCSSCRYPDCDCSPEEKALVAAFLKGGFPR
ncbi:MAG TPA: hypothetical protein VFT82_04265 [Candidatus Paceibacterota bacterium]|nr:hypothetical protein [Candidatus Paceibacterota bacterium]